MQDLDIAIAEAIQENLPKSPAIKPATPFLTGTHMEVIATVAHAMKAERQKAFTEMLGEVYGIINTNQGQLTGAAPITPPRFLTATQQMDAKGIGADTAATATTVDLTMGDSPPSVTKSEPGNSPGRRNPRRSHSIGMSPLKDVYFQESGNIVTSSNYHPTGFTRRTGKAPPRSVDVDLYEAHVVQKDPISEGTSQVESAPPA